jgi:aminomethyltransferase
MPRAAANRKTTPLNVLHRFNGARMIEFGGWDMPVEFSSILEEHHAVRRAVGLFDVSHMGKIEIRGLRAAIDLIGFLMFSPLVSKKRVVG